MKRLLLAALFGGGSLAVTFVLRPGPLVGQAPPAAVGGAPCCVKEEACKEKGCCLPLKKTKDDAEVVAELVKILDQTKSGDTFVATLLALSQFEDKSPLPAVVRNASRLGLLKGLCKEDKPNHAQEMIGAYLSGEMVAEFQCGSRPNNGPAAATMYPPCVPSPYWNSGPSCPQISTYAPAPMPASYSFGCGSSGGLTAPCGMPLVCPTPERIAAPKPVSEAPAKESKDAEQIFSFWTGFSK